MCVVFDPQVFRIQRYGGVWRILAAHAFSLRAIAVDERLGCVATINGHLLGPALRIPARLHEPRRRVRRLLQVHGDRPRGLAGLHAGERGLDEADAAGLDA